MITALFAAEQDAIIDPILSPQGSWFSKPTEKRPGRTTGFDEAEGRIAQEITRTKRQAACDEFIEKLRADADIEQFPDRLNGALESETKSSGPPAGQDERLFPIHRLENWILSRQVVGRPYATNEAVGRNSRMDRSDTR